MHSVRSARLAGALALTAALSGCAFWLPDAQRIDIQQGNILDAQAIAQLEPGQSRARVRELLGAPALNTPFHANRWDYIYYLTEFGGEAKPQRLTVVFGPGGIESIEERYSVPEDPLPDAPSGPLPDAEKPAPAPQQGPGGGGPSPSPTPGPGPG
jgi:outer membrane protein assembly factor BamE